MTIDTNGKLWVACYGAGAVYQFDPETGTKGNSLEKKEHTDTLTYNFPRKFKIKELIFYMVSYRTFYHLIT